MTKHFLAHWISFSIATYILCMGGFALHHTLFSVNLLDFITVVAQKSICSEENHLEVNFRFMYLTFLAAFCAIAWLKEEKKENINVTTWAWDQALESFLRSSSLDTVNVVREQSSHVHLTSLGCFISGRVRFGQNTFNICILWWNATGSQKTDILLPQNPVQKCELLRNWPNTNFGVEKASSRCLIIPWPCKKYKRREIKRE